MLKALQHRFYCSDLDDTVSVWEVIEMTKGWDDYKSVDHHHTGSSY